MTELLSILQDLAPAVEFGFPGRAYAFALLVIVPFVTLFQPDVDQIELPPRNSLYISAILGIGVLTLFVFLTLVIEDVPINAVGFHGSSLNLFLGWTAFTTIVALAGDYLITRIALGFGLKESKLTYHLMPTSGREHWAFLGVSASAGFGEELTYHGFLLAGLAGWLGNGWLAALLANLAFGLLHGYQGHAGVVRAFLMGYVFCLPVVTGAGLWPAMAGHFLVNAVLGLGLWKYMVPEDERPVSQEG